MHREEWCDDTSGLEFRRTPNSADDMLSIFPSLFSYVLLTTLLVVDVVWIWLGNVRIHGGDFGLGSVLFAFVVPATFMLRRKLKWEGSKTLRALGRGAVMLQGTGFLLMAWVALRVFNHLSMTISFAYVDQLLSRWDESLGFDWISYFRFVESSHVIETVLRHCYTSLTPLSLIAYFILAFQVDLRKAAFFLETFFVVAVVCTVIGMFFPAKAAVATYIGASADFSAFGKRPGLYHLTYLERLRETPNIILDLRHLPGLVTFPSFHTAAGVVLAWSFRRSALFWPVIGYVVMMIASTPVFGGHYFVDLLAGTGVAGVILAGYSRRRRYFD